MSENNQNQINITLFGHGNTGAKVSEAIAENDNFRLNSVIARTNPHATHDSLSLDSLKNTDVIIDFSHGPNVLQIVKAVLDINPNIRIVTGTSGWQAEESEVRKLVEDNGLYFLYGANFSVGTAIWMDSVVYTASRFDKVNEVKVILRDEHHSKKKDPYSGTVIKLANRILEVMHNKTGIIKGEATDIPHNQIQIISSRNGYSRGFHEVTFDLPGETIRLSQQTSDRIEYATGSLKAAQWLMQQSKPGFYSFEDYLKI